MRLIKIDDNNEAAQNVLTFQQCEDIDSGTQPMSLYMQSENTNYCDPNDICQNCKSLKSHCLDRQCLSMVPQEKLIGLRIRAFGGTRIYKKKKGRFLNPEEIKRHNECGTIVHYFISVRKHRKVDRWNNVVGAAPRALLEFKVLWDSDLRASSHICGENDWLIIRVECCKPKPWFSLKTIEETIQKEALKMTFVDEDDQCNAPETNEEQMSASEGCRNCHQNPCINGKDLDENLLQKLNHNLVGLKVKGSPNIASNLVGATGTIMNLNRTVEYKSKRFKAYNTRVTIFWHLTKELCTLSIRSAARGMRFTVDCISYLDEDLRRDILEMIEFEKDCNKLGIDNVDSREDEHGMCVNCKKNPCHHGQELKYAGSKWKQFIENSDLVGVKVRCDFRCHQIHGKKFLTKLGTIVGKEKEKEKNIILVKIKSLDIALKFCSNDNKNILRYNCRKININEMESIGNDKRNAKTFEDILKEEIKSCEDSRKFVDLVLSSTKLATFYLEQGRYEECIDVTEEAVEIGVMNNLDKDLIAQTWYLVGESYRNLMFFECAKNCYENAFKLSVNILYLSHLNKMESALNLTLTSKPIVSNWLSPSAS